MDIQHVPRANASVKVVVLKRNRFKHWTLNSNRVITRYTCVTTSKSHAINFDLSSSPFFWEDVAPAWRWSLQVRTWHHRLQRKCCRKGVSQNIQHNRILVPSKYPTEYHHCWQRNYVRYIFFFENLLTFWSSHCPKPGSRGAADVALVPGCHCNALRSNTGLCHLPLPVVWSPKVGGGIAVVLQLVPTERNWAAGKRKVGRRERDGFPPVLAPGSARPRRKCFPPNSRLPNKCCSNLNKWEIFHKTNKVQRGNNSVYCHVFLI